MFIKDIRLVNYVGIYNGLKINELYIDFSATDKGIFVIVGDNGSGKTTLLEALSPLPDDNSCFIKKMPASKELTIIHEDITYFIRFVHDVNKKGDRETTKAYMTKIEPFGEEIAMNPNGNVSSFKDVIYDEFSLDANFLTLSYLSSIKRGIGVLTSGERKKFVNSIISCLATYNDIFKALSKRSNIFKSMMNNISSKIKNIGDEDKLKLSLESLENRINDMMNDKDRLYQELAEANTKVRLLDPNNSIQNNYNDIYNRILDINERINNLSNEIAKTITSNFKLPSTTTFEEFIEFNNTVNKEYSDLEVTVRVEESSILSLISERENESKGLQEKVAKLDTLKSEVTTANLEKVINMKCLELENNKNMIQRMGISLDISKEEFLIGIETLNNIRDSIINYKSDKEYGLLQKAAEVVKGNVQIFNLGYYNDELETSRASLEQMTTEYNKLKMLEYSVDILKNRPSNCINDSCSFISSALADRKILDSVDLNQLESDINSCRDHIQSVEKDKEEYTELQQYINTLNNITRDIRTHANIFKKLPIDFNTFSNIDSLVNMVVNGYQFEEISALYQEIQYADLIEQIKSDEEQLKKLQEEFNISHSKYQLIDDISQQINSINEKIDKISSDLSEKQQSISNNKNRLSMLNSMKMCFNTVFNMFNEKKRLEDNKLSLLSSFNAIKQDMMIIKQSLDQVAVLNDKIDFTNREIQPLMKDRDNLRFGIGQLEEYKVELESFNAKYQKVETIKKYCSPSKDGIQNVFIELYMNTTLKLTNELLSLLFDGEYMVGDFIINDKEFRIPVIGSGVPNDDLSSMSNAQVSMISMIISFVMLHQSSTKYNVIKLDEIDGSLDTNNRLQFTFVLEKIRQILGIEQTFMISHNIETDMSDVALIIFKCKDADKFKNCDILFNIAS